MKLRTIDTVYNTNTAQLREPGSCNIRDEICKDTPVTDINKPYIDNIDAYNRDKALITKSFSDRLDLGQNSLMGAQQVRVAVKHTDQITKFPEHLR